MSKADLARLREVVFRDYRRKLTLAEKGYAGQFSTLLKLLRKHGIKLEEA